MKFLLALALGVAGGYYLGFSDGSEGKPSIVTRLVERVGGTSRGRVANDIDATMDRLDGTASAADSAKAAGRKRAKARTQ
jgi:hypothetical protein